jgi:hypothetical protein
MNKKPLIFLLLAILLLALSLIAYSWTEPTTMPSSYNPPINTSSIAQTKTGEIGASMFRDADNSNYYINPSGNSMISGKIITSNPTIAGDVPNTVATKGYVDSLFGGGDDEEEISETISLVYRAGKNPNYEEGVEILRHWTQKTCVGANSKRWSGCTGTACSTPASWTDSQNPPTCVYKTCNYNSNHENRTCTANEWDAVIYAKVEDVLYGQKHTEPQCVALGGTVVTVEGDVKICKFPVTTQCFKQRGCGEGICSLGSGCGSYTREAVYECPGGWTKYKKFVTTKRKTWSSKEFIHMCRDCSDSRPDCDNVCYNTATCVANPTDKRVFKNGIDSCSVYCDSAWSCGEGNYYGQAEVIEAGCY